MLTGLGAGEAIRPGTRSPARRHDSRQWFRTWLRRPTARPARARPRRASVAGSEGEMSNLRFWRGSEVHGVTSRERRGRGSWIREGAVNPPAPGIKQAPAQDDLRVVVVMLASRAQNVLEEKTHGRPSSCDENRYDIRVSCKDRRQRLDRAGKGMMNDVRGSDRAGVARPKFG